MSNTIHTIYFFCWMSIYRFLWKFFQLNIYVFKFSSVRFIHHVKFALESFIIHKMSHFAVCFYRNQYKWFQFIQSFQFFKIIFWNFCEYIVSMSIVCKFSDSVFQFVSVAVFLSIRCFSSLVWIFCASVSFIPNDINCVSVCVQSEITSIKNSVFSIILWIFNCWAEVSVDCVSLLKNFINFFWILVDSIICNFSQISVFFVSSFTY